MPTFARAPQSLAAVEADSVAVFALRGGDISADVSVGEVDAQDVDVRPVLGADARAAAQALGIDLAAELAGLRFTAELGAVARIPTRGAIPAPILLVVGLGRGDDLTLERLRRGAGAAARNATKDSTLALAVPFDLISAAAAETVSAAVEGAGLGAYAYSEYRTKTADLPSLQTIVILPGDAAAGDVDLGISTGEVVVDAVSLTRDLVNTPPAYKRPPALADRVVAAAREAGLLARVFDKDALVEGGFGGILGVGQGSSEPPRLVELTYEPPGDAPPVGTVVLVGKGITFDTGGISLKPTNSMTTMKSDMSGAAAVLGTMTALRDLGVTVRVTGLLALAENMPSGDAIRVSDVLTHRGGTTVEVMNTDAEGRLVLADALAYGAESQPDVLIDLATLTGAQIVALGNDIAGLMGSDETLIAELKAAADAAGEQLWQLPLPEQYADHLKSEVADLKNIGRPGQAGTIVAGLFLKEFTSGRPWAHLDIAGPAFTEEGDGFYTAKGGTGMGVRTLLRYLRDRSERTGS